MQTVSDFSKLIKECLELPIEARETRINNFKRYARPINEQDTEYRKGGYIFYIQDFGDKFIISFDISGVFNDEFYSNVGQLCIENETVSLFLDKYSNEDKFPFDKEIVQEFFINMVAFFFE